MIPTFQMGQLGRSFQPASAGATDPYFSSVVYLCHFEGTDGQVTPPVESSSYARTITAGGGPQLLTAQKKFGVSSSNGHGGSTAAWQCAQSVDFCFSGGQFTLDAWVYFSSAPGGGSVNGVISVADFAAQGFFFGYVFGQLRLYYSTDGANWAGSPGGNWTPSTGVWYHIAADRDSGNTLRLYVDGSVIYSGTLSATFANANTILQVAGNVRYGGLTGYVDEVRITKGVARYAGAFTPPTAAFPDG